MSGNWKGYPKWLWSTTALWLIAFALYLVWVL